jgi:hypothetical protein
MAIVEACKKYVWLKGLYAELCGDNSCVNLFCNSQNAIYVTKDQMFHERSKHIDIKCHHLLYCDLRGTFKACLNFNRTGRNLLATWI